MGLSIAVGFLAQMLSEVDESEIEEFERPYLYLNEVLHENGMKPHNEPKSLTAEQCFEAEMWGYGGLHNVRRLAAYVELEDQLPPLDSNIDILSEDPMTERLYEEYQQYFNEPNLPLFGRVFSRQKRKPRFQHLMYHSDAEGFYLPRDFEDVIFDSAEPQREGLGAMVGSSVALLRECQVLASWIGLPKDMDHDSEELWEFAEQSSKAGPVWAQYGLEAFGLSRLIKGCQASINTNSALLFT